jgi:hypothetical protein
VEFFAHLDEGGGRLPSGNRLYGFAAVLTSASIHDNITEALFGELLPHRPYLHHYDETPERRLKIADTLSALPLSGAIVITEITATPPRNKPAATCSASCCPGSNTLRRSARSSWSPAAAATSMTVGPWTGFDDPPRHRRAATQSRLKGSRSTDLDRGLPDRLLRLRGAT